MGVDKHLFWTAASGRQRKIKRPGFLLATNKGMAAKKRSVNFVCLGNICRSTMAEGIFQHLVEQRGLKDQWSIDSSGTGAWHIGSPPHEGTMRELRRNGITGYKHRGRQICPDDFKTFEFIFGMDHDNIEDIKEVAPKDSTAKILLLGSFDPKKD